MDELLDFLRTRYELIILDTGPVLAASETRILARKADGVLMVAAWRKTPVKAIEGALAYLDDVGAEGVGIALTKVDMKRQIQSGYGDPSFYYPQYSSYYKN